MRQDGADPAGTMPLLLCFAVSDAGADMVRAVRPTVLAACGAALLTARSRASSPS